MEEYAVVSALPERPYAVVSRIIPTDKMLAPDTDVPCVVNILYAATARDLLAGNPVGDTLDAVIRNGNATALLVLPDELLGELATSQEDLVSDVDWAAKKLYDTYMHCTLGRITLAREDDVDTISFVTNKYYTLVSFPGRKASYHNMAPSDIHAVTNIAGIYQVMMQYPSPISPS